MCETLLRSRCTTTITSKQKGALWSSSLETIDWLVARIQITENTLPPLIPCQPEVATSPTGGCALVAYDVAQVHHDFAEGRPVLGILRPALLYEPRQVRHLGPDAVKAATSEAIGKGVDICDVKTVV